jgi:hypothetical protein
MIFLRALRRLVLGETWTLPLTIAVALGLAVTLRALADRGWWHEAGGPVTAVLSLIALAASLRARS